MKLCRNSFGHTKELLEIISEKLVKCSKEIHHVNHPCKECKKTPIGLLHRCKICPDHFLCSACFKNGSHPEHAFQSKGRARGEWVTAERHVPYLMPEPVLNQIQNAEIYDYEQLLLFDQPQLQGALSLHAINQFKLKKVKSLRDLLDLRDQTCQVCGINGAVGDIFRIMPCRHSFHQQCIGIATFNQISGC
jgi:hypothetical protein